MFKTSEECRLDLVAHSVLANAEAYSPKETIAEQNLDFLPCSAARVSFGNEDKTGKNVEADKKLMKYLADHKHMTPFEYQHATFLVECPLFIRSQIHRHRTFAFNEISRRYTSENLEFWVPTTVRKQSTNNKQASDGEHEDQSPALWMESAETCLDIYNAMVERGIPREQARAVLPQSLLTKFYMGGVLRNWVHFIELRRDPHAQKEVQIIAERIAEELRKLWPESCAALGI